MTGETCVRGQGRLRAAGWVRRNLQFRPDGVQAQVLNSPARRVLLNCTRQWGKSTIAAAKALFEAQRQNGALILVVSPRLRQSREFMRKVEGFAALAVARGEGLMKRDRDGEISLELPNRSRIVAVGGSAEGVRCYSGVSLAIVDEAARVNDEVYKALRPALAASGGSLWLMGTPFGKRGFFYKAWSGGGREWLRVEVPAQRCRRIPAVFLREERGVLCDRWYGQEYECKFGEVEEGIFDPDLIERAFREDVTPLDLD